MSSAVYKKLISELNSGNGAAVVTNIYNGDNIGEYQRDKFLLTKEQLSECSSRSISHEEICRKAYNVLTVGNIEFTESENGNVCLIEPYFPKPRLIILGGGHIARPLAEFGSKVGFSVTVVDDRPAFANRLRFTEADRVICDSFDKCFDTLKVDNSAFIVIVTRGHRHDLDCLRQVLCSKASYIGMIGSKRRIKNVRENMAAEGFSQEALERVKMPIGLEIGAVTPEEIAVAIIAQVIGYRRHVFGMSEQREASKPDWTDYDRYVLQELAKEDELERAVVTIISTRGSVPRKGGAKMLVWADGRVLGSIGGGCSEGQAIRVALDVIKTGKYQILEIDLTGYAAEEEGMVCGGKMKVFIEPCKI